MADAITLDARHVDAVLLDLDGVVTSTARLHAAAWKATFDAFLKESTGDDFLPFDAVGDYARFVDGRLRQDGVKAFLASRGISLPPGDPTDVPGFETVWAIGNRKNEHFRELISEQGVDVFEDARDLISRVRRAGISTGLVTASRNCRLIVEKSGLTGLFEATIDGIDAEHDGLRGKPEPDMFLAAAKALDADPGRVVVIEDAPAGVEAARAGSFRLAIQVSRTGEELPREPGRVVVTNLAQISVAGLPCATDSLDEICAGIRGKPHAVLLDYDGTLTPIVARPELAVLSDDMRGVLSRLVKVCPTGIVTGRSLADIRRLVDVDLSFVASHGMEVQLRGHPAEANADAHVSRAISEAADAIEERLRDVPGLIVERKPFSVAVHYRLVDEVRLPEVFREIDRQIEAKPSLRILSGKKVKELRPDTDWDKGKAVVALAARMGVPREGIIYLGDDITDEDAFKALRDAGIGIAVMSEVRRTAAAYLIRGEDGVREFLEGLLRRLERNEAL